MSYSVYTYFGNMQQKTWGVTWKQRSRNSRCLNWIPSCLKLLLSEMSCDFFVGITWSTKDWFFCCQCLSLITVIDKYNSAEKKCVLWFIILDRTVWFYNWKHSYCYLYNSPPNITTSYILFYCSNCKRWCQIIVKTWAQHCPWLTS